MKAKVIKVELVGLKFDLKNVPAPETISAIVNTQVDSISKWFDSRSHLLFGGEIEVERPFLAPLPDKSTLQWKKTTVTIVSPEQSLNVVVRIQQQSRFGTFVPPILFNNFSIGDKREWPIVVKVTGKLKVVIEISSASCK